MYQPGPSKGSSFQGDNALHLNKDIPLDLSKGEMNLRDEGKVQQCFQNDDCPNTKIRRYPEITPTEGKDARYWANRIRNNAAARRSRRSRRIRELNLIEHAARLEEKCCILEHQIQCLQVLLFEATQSRIDDKEYSEKVSPHDTS